MRKNDSYTTPKQKRINMVDDAIKLNKWVPGVGNYKTERGEKIVFKPMRKY